MLHILNIDYAPRQPLMYSIDRGLETNPRPTPTIELNGWCFHQSVPVRNFTMEVPEGTRILSDYPLLRPDVAGAFSDQAGALHSGFYINIVTQAVHESNFAITINAQLEDGTECPMVTLQIQQSFAPPLLLPRELNTWSQKLQRRLSPERWVIYTVITNQHELLLAPAVIEPDIAYVALVDDLAVAVPSPWEKRLFFVPARNPRVMSRHPKILPHLYFPDATHSLYIDAQIYLREDTRAVRAAALVSSDLAAFNHRFRTTVRDEAEEIKRVRIDEPARVDNQLAFYQQVGFPDSMGLIESGVLFRRHRRGLLSAMETWWDVVVRYSHRDQLGLMYALWKHSVGFTWIPGTVETNSFLHLTRYAARHSYTE